MAELERVRTERRGIVGALEGMAIALVRSCNDRGILYGSVTQRDISDALKELGHYAKVLVPMAGGGTRKVASSVLESTLVLAARNDSICAYKNEVSGYGSTIGKKRFVVVGDAGHLFCSDLCWIGEPQGGIVAIAASHGFGSKIAQSESARTQARGAGDGRRSGGRRSPATE